MICSSLNEQQNNENTKLPNLTTYYLIPNSIQRVSGIFMFKPHGGQNEELEIFLFCAVRRGNACR